MCGSFWKKIYPTKLSLRILGLFLLAGAIYGLLGGAKFVLAEANQNKILTVYDQATKEELVLITNKPTLREALDQAGLELAANDNIEPELDTELVADRYQVNIYRSRPIIVIDGPKQVKILSTDQTPSKIVEAAGLDWFPEDKANIELDFDNLASDWGVKLVINRAKKVNLTLFGKKAVVRTHAATLEQFLVEKDIKLDNKTRSSHPAQTTITDGMNLDIWREGKQEVTVTEPVDFQTKTIEDHDRDASYKLVKTPGVKGEAIVTYEITIRNGKEVDRQKIKTVTTKQPIDQVEVVGAKFNYTGGPLNDAQITALGMCESGMTASRNSGNGFYGAFQFMPQTWSSVAPEGYKNMLPHQAPLDAQKQAVQNLLSRSSIYSQFPGCASKMRSEGLL